MLAFGYRLAGQDPAADGSGAFGEAYLASAAFGLAQGWTSSLTHIELADVNGDGALDILGFGNDLTAVASVVRMLRAGLSHGRRSNTRPTTRGTLHGTMRCISARQVTSTVTERLRS